MNKTQSSKKLKSPFSSKKVLLESLLSTSSKELYPESASF